MLKLGHFSERRSEVPEDFEMWCWRRMEKISWTDRVRKVLNRVRKESNSQHTVIGKKANWIGHILCRNCLRDTEGEK
jgi:hypothetical protein